MRGLDEFLQSPRGRPCCVPRATPVRPGRRLRGCTLLPHLTVGTKRKGETGALQSVFVFEKTALWQLELTLEVNETGLVGSRRFHCAKRGPKRTPRYLLRQFRLGFELQPPPLSGTPLAERLPLRIPGIHDYALLSATESSTHTDVIMVVVLRSRDAVSLRLQVWLDSPPKIFPAAPPAPPESTCRDTHSIPLNYRASYGSNRCVPLHSAL